MGNRKQKAPTEKNILLELTNFYDLCGRCCSKVEQGISCQDKWLLLTRRNHCLYSLLHLTHTKITIFIWPQFSSNIGVSHLVQRHNLFTYFTTQNFLCSKICKQIMSLDQMRDPYIPRIQVKDNFLNILHAFLLAKDASFQT